MKSDLLIVNKSTSLSAVKPPRGHCFLTLAEGIALFEKETSGLPWSFWVWSKRYNRALRIALSGANFYTFYVVVSDGVAPGCVWKKKKARGRTEAKR